MGGSSTKVARKRRSLSARASKDLAPERTPSSFPSNAGAAFPEQTEPRRSAAKEVGSNSSQRLSSDGFIGGRYDRADFIFGGGSNDRGDHSGKLTHGGSASSTPRNVRGFLPNQVEGPEEKPPVNASGPEAVLWRAMKDRKNLCKDLWDRLQMEVQVQEALWFSEREARGQAEASEEEIQARSLIVTAVNSGEAQHLHAAIAEAKQLLGGSISETLEECLLELCQTEEAYVALLSVLRALREGDRVELETWVEAMQVIGLSQADLDAAQNALKLLKKQEASALERLQVEQRIYEKLVFAMETQDIGTLRDVIAEARAAGVDAAPAQAALEELLADGRRAQRSRQRERSPERTGQEEPPEAGAGGPSSSGSTYHGPHSQYRNSGGASSSSNPYYGNDGGTGGSGDAAGGFGAAAGGRAPGQPGWQEEYDARRQEWERRRAEWERERRDWEARREERRRDWEQQRQTWDEREQRNQEYSKRTTGSSSSAGFGQGFGAGPQGDGASRNKSASSSAVGGRSEALQLLGFQPFTRPDPAELRAAYRKACLKWHPDRRHNHACPEEATHQFQRVKAAFDLLAEK